MQKRFRWRRREYWLQKVSEFISSFEKGTEKRTFLSFAASKCTKNGKPSKNQMTRFQRVLFQHIFWTEKGRTEQKFFPIWSSRNEKKRRWVPCSLLSHDLSHDIVALFTLSLWFVANMHTSSLGEDLDSVIVRCWSTAKWTKCLVLIFFFFFFFGLSLRKAAIFDVKNSNSFKQSFVLQGKWEVPLPKVKGVSEAEVFKVVKSGKTKSKWVFLFYKKCRCDILKRHPHQRHSCLVKTRRNWLPCEWCCEMK